MERQAIHIDIPPSKSLSHRYVIAASLASGRSVVHHVLESDDLKKTREILGAAGAKFYPLDVPSETGEMPDSCDWEIVGMNGQPQGGDAPTPLSCYVHESGTTCRLLTAVLAAGQGFFRIHGASRMHERPIEELTKALAQLGTDISFEQKTGYPPLVLGGHGLNPKLVNGKIRIGMDVSSQYFSGLLLAAPLSMEPLTLELSGNKAVSWPYVGLTLQCLDDFGIKFDVETRQSPETHWQSLAAGGWRGLDQAKPDCLRITVQPGQYCSGDFFVEGDWSGASYFLAAGAVGPNPVTVHGLNSLSTQGDRKMLDILRQMGADVRCDQNAVTVCPSCLKGNAFDMGACPDLVPTVAVLASLAHGDTLISNVAHLRVKESDRLAAPAEELAKLGIDVEIKDDGLLVHGLGKETLGVSSLDSGNVMFSTHNDHRIAMSLALISLVNPALDISSRLDDPTVVRKSFPNFWNIWKKLQ